jgi:hypothetical protein
MPLGPFQVLLGSDAPAGRVELLVQGLEVRATYAGRVIDTTLDLKPVRGYLLPRAYDVFWQPFLFRLAMAITALPIALIIAVGLYSLFYEKENPLYVLLDLVDRWKGVFLGYAIVLASLWLMQALVFAVLRWQYG